MSYWYKFELIFCWPYFELRSRNKKRLILLHQQWSLTWALLAIEVGWAQLDSHYRAWESRTMKKNIVDNKRWVGLTSIMWVWATEEVINGKISPSTPQSSARKTKMLLRAFYMLVEMQWIVSTTLGALHYHDLTSWRVVRLMTMSNSCWSFTFVIFATRKQTNKTCEIYHILQMERN